MTDENSLEGLRWLILGCGYTGERLALRLVREGADVTVTTRSGDRALELQARLSAGNGRATVLVGDPSVEGSLSSLIYAGATVINSIPPSDEAGGFETLVAKACEDGGAKRVIYLSSTGVYGRGDGTWTNEDTPTNPLSPRGARRLAAELAMRAAKAEVVALRVAAIYGPGRGVQARLARGDYRIYGDGSSKVSRVHVDDLVGVIIDAARVASPSRDVYCVADNLPTSSREHADGIAEMMGIAPPPSVPKSEASQKVLAMLGSDRRISNRSAVEELSWVLKYPTWREGTAAIIAGAAEH